MTRSGQVRPWLVYATITTLAWGVWGACMEFPEKNGFPATLGYTTWVATMIPCALLALMRGQWKFNQDYRSICLGGGAGLLGAGGQLILFSALKQGPAYVIFPVISLYPMLTVLLSVTLLKEKTRAKNWVGIGVALLAICLLSYQPPDGTGASGYLWFALAALVFVMWGTQVFVLKLASDTMSSESIFFYMMLSAVALVPVALIMTDFTVPVNWGFSGAWLSTGIQFLNSVGALFLVYAIRHGKVIIVTPLTALAPVITIILSLILYRTLPNGIVMTGLALAIVAIFMLLDNSGQRNDERAALVSD